jgi:hypothetical protein
MHPLNTSSCEEVRKNLTFIVHGFLVLQVCSSPPLIFYFYVYFLCERHRDIAVNVREIGVGWGKCEVIHSAENRDQWQSLVNMEMSLRVPQNAVNFLSG